MKASQYISLYRYSRMGTCPQTDVLQHGKVTRPKKSCNYFSNVCIYVIIRDRGLDVKLQVLKSAQTTQANSDVLNVHSWSSWSDLSHLGGSQ